MHRHKTVWLKVARCNYIGDKERKAASGSVLVKVLANVTGKDPKVTKVILRWPRRCLRHLFPHDLPPRPLVGKITQGHLVVHRGLAVMPRDNSITTRCYLLLAGSFFVVVGGYVFWHTRNRWDSVPILFMCRLAPLSLSSTGLL